MNRSYKIAFVNVDKNTTLCEIVGAAVGVAVGAADGSAVAKVTMQHAAAASHCTVRPMRLFCFKVYV